FACELPTANCRLGLRIDNDDRIHSQPTCTGQGVIVRAGGLYARRQGNVLARAERNGRIRGRSGNERMAFAAPGDGGLFSGVVLKANTLFTRALGFVEVRRTVLSNMDIDWDWWHEMAP